MTLSAEEQYDDDYHFDVDQFFVQQPESGNVDDPVQVHDSDSCGLGADPLPETYGTTDDQTSSTITRQVDAPTLSDVANETNAMAAPKIGNPKNLMGVKRHKEFLSLGMQSQTVKDHAEGLQGFQAACMKEAIETGIKVATEAFSQKIVELQSATSILEAKLEELNRIPEKASEVTTLALDEMRQDFQTQMTSMKAQTDSFFANATYKPLISDNCFEGKFINLM